MGGVDRKLPASLVETRPQREHRVGVDRNDFPDALRAHCAFPLAWSKVIVNEILKRHDIESTTPSAPRMQVVPEEDACVGLRCERALLLTDRRSGEELNTAAERKQRSGEGSAVATLPSGVPGPSAEGVAT